MKKLSLNGSWLIKEESKNLILKGNVPGVIHTDLLAAKKIPDPFYRDNEKKVLWVSQADWRYIKKFSVEKRDLKCDKILLRCEGLDTFAELYLNGKLLGCTNNAFRMWEFDIKDALRTGTNSLEVFFKSAFNYAIKKQKESPLPTWQLSMANGVAAWIRKSQCNFGWDWGPKLPTCGIWRDIGVLFINDARFDDVYVVQEHKNREVILWVRIKLERTSDFPLLIKSNLAFQGKSLDIQYIEVPSHKSELVIKIEIKDPQLWWPNGMGAQPLYDLQLWLIARPGKVADEKKMRIGLRTLKLDRHPDQWGESFQFVVNGVPFFAKGANWIPADAFVTELTKKDYARLLNDAAKANMNMLRLWGGGIFEADCFYDICDELGICIWHDFMFACSAYPVFEKGFLENVRQEIIDNVKKLRHHPSIALWCGNNELECGLVGSEWNERAMSWLDYDKLFNQLIPETLREVDPERDYWPASPHSPHNRNNSEDPTNGDAHLWGVWHGKKPFEWYRTCNHRFVSEFGFQSFPELSTLRKYVKEEDLNFTSPVMEHFQRSGIGNTTIIQYMLSWFRMPIGFKNTVVLSQIQQALAMKYAVEHWRRNMPRTMGALYWQLNDCWCAPTWSSIDYEGRWKALHYFAKKFFAPVMLSILEKKETHQMEVYITSDRTQLFYAELRWIAQQLNGKTLMSGRETIEVPSLKNTLVATIDLKDVVAKYGENDILFYAELIENGKNISENFATFVVPKKLKLAKPSFSCKVRELDNKSGRFLVSIQADKPAMWVCLKTDDAEDRLSDNYFCLLKVVEKEITISRRKKTDVPAMVNALKIISIVDTYIENGKE